MDEKLKNTILWDIYKKIKSYKRLITIFVALNVFSIISSAVISFYYYTAPYEIVDQKQIEIRKLEEQTSFFLFLEKEEIDDKAIFKVNHLLTQFKILPEDQIPLSRNEFLTKRRDILQSIHKSKMSHLNEIANLYSFYKTKQEQLMWIGVLSLIFGVVLPSVVFYILTQLVKNMKTEAEQNVSNWIQSWHHEQSKHSEPFKNPIFWSKIALISVEQFSPMFNHPISIYASKVSHEILNEMKSAEEQIHADDHADSQDLHKAYLG